MSDPTELDSRRRRLVFRAQHRGTKETDILIGGFVARHIATLSDAEVTALEEILELWDVDLADWLSGRRPIPPEHDTPLLRRIQAEAGGGR
ncbi:MAG: succinate dehydrogenase assembly factor 2 [Roseomonas sp.]|nr:succinate dehydrogenase assembly factor 2 [Roseomonas sp.]